MPGRNALRKRPKIATIWARLIGLKQYRLGQWKNLGTRVFGLDRMSAQAWWYLVLQFM